MIVVYLPEFEVVNKRINVYIFQENEIADPEL